MYVSITLDKYCKGMLFLILICLLWLCLDRPESQKSLALGDEGPKDKGESKILDIVAARTLHIYDKNKKIRATLTADEGMGPTLSLIGDRDGDDVSLDLESLCFSVDRKPRAGLEVKDRVARIFLRDQENKKKANIIIDAHGSSSLELEQEKGCRVYLSAGANGGSGLSVFSPTDQHCASLSVGPDGSTSFSLRGTGKAEILSYASRGVAGITLEDSTTKPRVVIGPRLDTNEKDPPSWIRVFDPDEKLRWSAP